MAEQTSKADRVKLNRELAQMLKGGVIMDVTTPEQARIAEEAGACAVMALERIPADIRAAGGVSRMSDPKMIKGIQEAVSIPVMAKCRIGHIVEAQVLQAIEIDYIDESEVLSPADDVYHIDKTQFDVPFVCGARDLGEALRRVAEGATMIRTKGEPGTGDVVQAVRHMRKIQKQIRDVVALRDDELFEAAKQLQVPVELVREVHATGKLPVVNFAAGGVATPADAALMMQLGAEGVFVGSGIFKSGDPAKRAAAIVKAVANFTDARLIAELSEDLGEAMVGINADEIVDYHGRARALVQQKGSHMSDYADQTVAVLAVQGAFAEHEARLFELGAHRIELRQAADLKQDFDRLVLPGGESTVQGKLLDELGMLEELRARIAEGMPVLGTCAGLILLAHDLAAHDDKGTPRLETMDVLVERNAYGRQLGSFRTKGQIAGIDGEVPLTFIRAPRIVEVHGDAKALAKVDGRIVAARQGNQLGVTFHPELDDDTRLHELFLQM